LIKGYSETEAPYSDEYIYHLFTTAAARLIRQREEKNHKQSDWNTPLYAVKLETDTIHGYGCLPGCNVLRTKYKIPKPVTARAKDMLKVYTLGMEEIRYINAADNKAIQLDGVYKNKLHYSIINEYVYIWNGDTTNVVPRAILISGYFIDPSLWSSVTTCTTDGEETNTPCFDTSVSEYPLDADLAYPAYQMTLDILKLSLQIPDDRTNEQAGQR
jgi:hypothetical protein